MNKVDNLYNALRGLETNMQKLRNEEAVLDYRIQEIILEWMNAERFARTINPDKKHLQCEVMESWNNRISEIERRLRFQRLLHARMLEVYNDLLKVEFSKFLN